MAPSLPQRRWDLMMDRTSRESPQLASALDRQTALTTGEPCSVLSPCSNINLASEWKKNEGNFNYDLSKTISITPAFMTSDILDVKVKTLPCLFFFFGLTLRP